MNNVEPVNKINIAHLKNWTSWLYSPIESKGRTTTRLKGKSQDLNELNSVLGNDEARKQFIENDASLAEAFTYTEDFTESFSGAIVNALSNLKRADNLSHKLNYFYSNVEEDLREVINLARKIKSVSDSIVKNEFEGDEFE